MSMSCSSRLHARHGKGTAFVKSTAYKDVTLQQLRSFCATARHGSFTAAAAALDLAHPTVWKQVHSLEQTFGAKLVEPHVRGCRLTEAGVILRDLTEPNVINLDVAELRARFGEALGHSNVAITIASTPRILADDLAPCIAAFVLQWPRVRFTLREANGDDVAALVENGAATFGFTTHVENRERFPALTLEPWYRLEIVLLTPRDHPLALKRRVRPEDLKPYPLVDAWNALRDTPAHGTLVELGLYRTEPRWVEARHVEVIRRCVESGLGIALVTALGPRKPNSVLHERVMHCFGRVTVYRVSRKGVNQHAAIQAFGEEVRLRLSRDASGRARQSGRRGKKPTA
jgi:DNA-binding transcriptional LysR family regulator